MIMSPKRTSTIWYHFKKTEGNKAECNTCKTVLSTAGGSYGNLRRHFKSKHPTAAFEEQRGNNVALGPEDSSSDVPHLIVRCSFTFQI